jgi:hypothetical protein
MPRETETGWRQRLEARACADDPRPAFEREIVGMFAEADARGIPASRLPGRRDLHALDAQQLVNTRHQLAAVLEQAPR